MGESGANVAYLSHAAQALHAQNATSQALHIAILSIALLDKRTSNADDAGMR